MQTNYKTVIFDVDGTLLDTTEGVLAAVQYTIEKSGLPLLEEEKLKTFIGPPIQESFINTYGVSKETAQELAVIFRARYKDYELLKAVPYDGIFEVMNKLQDNGIAIGIATYKRQDYAETIMNHFGFNRYAAAICGADNQNKLKKIDIIKNCMLELGVQDVKQAVMIGDSAHDAIGAGQLKMDFIGVTYGFEFRTKEDVCKHSCIGSADTTSQILDILKL